MRCLFRTVALGSSHRSAIQHADRPARSYIAIGRKMVASQAGRPFCWLVITGSNECTRITQDAWMKSTHRTRSVSSLPTAARQRPGRNVPLPKSPPAWTRQRHALYYRICRPRECRTRIRSRANIHSFTLQFSSLTNWGDSLKTEEARQR